MLHALKSLLYRSNQRFWGGAASTHVLTRLLGLLWEHRLKMAAAVACMIGYNVFTAAPAWYIKDVVDTLQAGDTPDINRFVMVGGAVVGIFAFKGLFFFGQNYLMGLVGQRMIANLRMRLYAHLQRLTIGFFTRTSSGELVTRFTSDLLNLQNAIRISIAGPLRDIPQIFLFLTILVIRSWELFLAAFIIIPVALGLISTFGRRNNKLTNQRLHTFGEMTSLLVETISGIRVVKAFSMEEYEKARFHRANEELLRKHLRTTRVESYAQPILELIGALAGACIIMFGGYLIIHSMITPGDFVSFLLAFFMLNEPIKKLNGFNMKLQEGMAAAARVFQLLDTEPEVEEKPGAVELPPFQDRIRIQIDQFTYAGHTEPALQDIDLEVRAGQVLALVGSSGAGKTTLVNLVPRFYELKQGMIEVDGHNIQDVTLRSLRSQIAIVTQDIFLFNDTVANNIDYGNIDCPRERIVEAAKAAYAHDFIMQLPQGYDTNIGQGGQHLSGGQRQRLAIARALIKDAPILILDEATSALDSESEKEVQKAIDALVRDRTTFVIAHRLSTVQRADKICVLDKGHVVEQGRHEELLRQGGAYKRLYEMQFRDGPHENGTKAPWRRLWSRVKGSEESLPSDLN